MGPSNRIIIMKLGISKAEIMSEFFGDKYLIGIRYPHHFSDFVTHVYEHLALKFENSNTPINKTIDSEESQGLFASISTHPSISTFQVLTAVDEIENSKHILYQNRLGTEYLVRSRTDMDLIWLVSDLRKPEVKSKELIGKINNIPGVQISQLMELQSLRNASYLII